MNRKLTLSTAALALTIALPVLAQQAPTTQPQTPAAQQQAPTVAQTPAAPVTPGASGTTAGAPTEATPAMSGPTPTPVPEQAENQLRADDLLGTDVSNGQEDIGEVTDLVFTREGQIDALIVGVGGFLGLGEKWVALSWDSVEISEQDGEMMIVTAATREELENMPEFKTLEEKQAESDRATMQQQMQQQQGTTPGATPTPAPAPQ